MLTNMFEKIPRVASKIKEPAIASRKLIGVRINVKRRPFRTK